MEGARKNELNSGCKEAERKLAELLLASAESAALPGELQAHLDGCTSCRRELAELRATMALLETWESPEPSPYFLTRLEARLREEREAEPAGWLQGGLARLRARFNYGPRTHLRPLAAMALTVLMLVGGGTYLGVTDWLQPPAAAGQAAVVRELQTMDSNAQLLDQLEALSSSNENGN
jgi:anti-sigma factor RsiW